MKLGIGLRMMTVQAAEGILAGGGWLRQLWRW